MPTSIGDLGSNFKEQVVLDVALDGHVDIPIRGGHLGDREAERRSREQVGVGLMSTRDGIEGSLRVESLLL